MLNAQRLTTSEHDEYPVEEDWKSLTMVEIFITLMAGINGLYGDEIAYCNARLIEMGIHYC